MYVFVFFFFQAEDGIRDLVRSRGLGDVYKRQALKMAEIPAAAPQASRRILSFVPKPNLRATRLPIAEPVEAIGASSPADPPKPTVRILVIIWE